MFKQHQGESSEKSNRPWHCVAVKSWSSRVVLGDPLGSNKAVRLILLNLVVTNAEDKTQEMVVEMTYEKAQKWLDVYNSNLS